jgi:hypothetical protein
VEVEEADEVEVVVADEAAAEVVAPWADVEVVAEEVGEAPGLEQTYPHQFLLRRASN